MFGLDVIAKDGLYANIALHPKVMGVGYERGLEKSCEYLLAKSQEIVPVDQGDLKASGYWYVMGHGLEAEGFVGYSAPYAGYVHEMVHYYHEPPTQAKFLEQPIQDHHHYMMTIVRREIDKQERLRLRSGVRWPGMRE